MSTNANNLQKEVWEYLTAKDWKVWKNQWSTYNHTLGIYLKPTKYDPVGSPDIMSVAPGGQFWGWEIKYGKDKVSAEQVLWKKQMTALGGRHVVVKSMADVTSALHHSHPSP